MTAAVFWLAQVYAGVRALGHGERHMPTAILLLGPLGLLEDDTAQDVAIAAWLVELAATGVLIARAAGARGVLIGVSAVISASFGVIVILLTSGA